MAELEKGPARYSESTSGIHGGHTVMGALGAKSVAEASGRGGETERGLKSRHIQFL